MKRKMVAALAACFVLGYGEPATATDIAPFKDALFDYGPMTASIDSGAVLDVPYDEARDIDQRDEIPERRAHRRYVDLSVVHGDREETLQTAAGPVRIRTVGNASAEPQILFVHGKDGNADLGMNDWTFGGNFNRLKNLVVRAGGAYTTVDAGALDAAAAERIAGVLDRLAVNGRKVIVACGSMGGTICWRLASDAAVAPALRGIVLLGASTNASALAAAPSGLPILIAHGSRDRIYDAGELRQAFDAARRAEPDRPLRMVIFDGGGHGTPIRMLDWRDTLNWMLAAR